MPRKINFTGEDDKHIIEVMSMPEGEKKKNAIIELCMKLGRTKKVIRNRYNKTLCKNNDKFSIDEDLMIIKLYKTYGNNWKLISKLLNNNRSNIKVSTRFHTLKRHAFNITEMHSYDGVFDTFIDE